MALQIVMPLPDVLAEISRVLRPGGRLVATTPAHGPLRAADLPVLAELLRTQDRHVGRCRPVEAVWGPGGDGERSVRSDWRERHDLHILG